MPDEASLKHLQELDNIVQKMLALETQAAQNLAEVRAIIQQFDAAHPENPAHHTPKLDAAVAYIEQCIAKDVDSHTQLVAEINAARDTAQAREDAGE